jgi:hypothetical protein
MDRTYRLQSTTRTRGIIDYNEAFAARANCELFLHDLKTRKYNVERLDLSRFCIRNMRPRDETMLHLLISEYSNIALLEVIING